MEERPELFDCARVETREEHGSWIMEGLVDLNRKFRSGSNRSAECLKGFHGGQRDEVIGFRF